MSVGKGPEMFMCVTLQGIRASEKEPSILEPHIYQCFPALETMPHDRIADFCFPDLDIYQNAYTGGTSTDSASTVNSSIPNLAHIRKSTFSGDISQTGIVSTEDSNITLLLTNTSGVRSYGYVRRFLAYPAPAHMSNAPQPLPPSHEHAYAICIISEHYWPKVFRKILAWAVDRLERGGWPRVTELLAAVLAKGAPPPGGQMEVCLQTDPRLPSRYLYARPNDLYAPVGDDVYQVFQGLGGDALVAVFAGALAERRIIFVGNGLLRVSKAVFAFYSLLWPFMWQHICISVLPPSLIEYLQSPIPFMLGVQSYHYEMAKPLLDDDLVVVDLDHNSVTVFPEDLESLPQGPLSALRQALADITAASAAAHRAMGGQAAAAAAAAVAENEAIYRAFRAFFAKVVGHYEKFFRTAASMVAAVPNAKVQEGRNVVFDTMAFLNSKGKSEKPFLTKFVETQLFMQFISNKEDELSRSMMVNDQSAQLSSSSAPSLSSTSTSPSLSPPISPQSQVSSQMNAGFLVKTQFDIDIPKPLYMSLIRSQKDGFIKVTFVDPDADGTHSQSSMHSIQHHYQQQQQQQQQQSQSMTTGKWLLSKLTPKKSRRPDDFPIDESAHTSKSPTPTNVPFVNEPLSSASSSISSSTSTTPPPRPPKPPRNSLSPNLIDFDIPPSSTSSSTSIAGKRQNDSDQQKRRSAVLLDFGESSASSSLESGRSMSVSSGNHGEKPKKSAAAAAELSALSFLVPNDNNGPSPLRAESAGDLLLMMDNNPGVGDGGVSRSSSSSLYTPTTVSPVPQRRISPSPPVSPAKSAHELLGVSPVIPPSSTSPSSSSSTLSLLTMPISQTGNVNNVNNNINSNNNSSAGSQLLDFFN